MNRQRVDDIPTQYTRVKFGKGEARTMPDCTTCQRKGFIGKICGCDGTYSEDCYSPDKPIATHADQFRSKSDEELAEWFAKISGDSAGGTAKFWLVWLRQPADK